MKPYELVVLLHPDLEIDLDKPLKKIENIVKEHKGKITKTDVWGKRKLAYPIEKEEFAVYAYYELELPPESVRKFESSLNITDEVIRYLISHPVPVVEEEDKENEEEDKKKESTKATTKTAKASTKAEKES